MRDELAAKIKSYILGPYNGEEEKISFRPLNLYTTGILYPQVKNQELQSSEQDRTDNEINSEKKEDDSENIIEKKSDKIINNLQKENDDSNYDDELKLATNFSPSSMGFSFIVEDNSEFKLAYCFGRYKRKEDKGNGVSWLRNHVSGEFSCRLKDECFEIDNQPVKEKWIFNEDDYKVKLVFFVRRGSTQSNTKKLITVSLINDLISSYGEQRKDALCVFQPSLKVFSEKPSFCFFEDNTDYSLQSDDSESLNTALLFRNYKVFAMGHGVSVDWKEHENFATEVTTEVMPEQLVKGVKFEVPGDSKVLEMKRLAGPDYNLNLSEQQLRKSFLEFANQYHKWIKQKNDELALLQIDENLKKQGQKNLDQCERLHERLLKGINLIFTDSKIKRAFYDANKAMFMQRVMSSFASWRRDKKSVIPGTEKYEDLHLPDFSELPSGGRNESENECRVFAKWRPFQLAFVLSQIEGIVKPESADRDTTDLIWFPTGGGKTEAYLGLIAFTLFYRRLREDNPDKGAGVSVMMRYTLRMLNLDQFQRANILISACEIIRSKNENEYGKIRFSSGIWVGSSLTPNKYKDKQGDVDYGYNSNLEKYIENVEKGNSLNVLYSPFLFNCPCCGNRLIKEKTKDGNVVGEWGYFRPFKLRDKKYPTGDYLVSCTNRNCHFFTDKLKVTPNNITSVKERCFPFFTVDEEIYRQRPSLLFGTVDKYAQIAWKRDSAKLFNLDIDNNNQLLNPGPELIIQDELHLIGSSLGTIYGLFEYAVDKLCSLCNVKPKIVGATATVKNAKMQCERLYNRKYFMQFPPPGIDADDSFYMKKNEEDTTARKYVGFMSSGFTSTTSVIRLASVLMETPNVFDVSNSLLDRYYTLLVYFNSLKELGKFRTFIDDDISANRRFLASQVFHKIHQNYSGRDIELSSAMSADDITNALENLKKEKLQNELRDDKLISYLRKKGIRSKLDWLETINKKETMSTAFFKKLDLKYADEYLLNKSAFDNFLENYYLQENSNTVKVATATNMIATGVDIPRLNLMLINGHPKSSSEYIQASSRVGREDAGLIFSFYSATKNRDRSHYENYKSFHQAFYQYVEPASVTPHSQPAMEKILPTILIALIWIIQRKSSEESFEYNNNIASFIEEIRYEIACRFGNKSEDYFNDIIEEIIKKWQSLAPKSRKFAGFADYFFKRPMQTISEHEVLDITAEYSSLAPHLIPKVSTMRDVEPSCNVKIKSNG